MDKSTYLGILLCGQAGLLLLDLKERLRTWPPETGSAAPRPRTAMFLVATVFGYAGLQYGGLALVPNVEALLHASRSVVGEFVSTAGDGAGRASAAFLVIGVAAFYFGGLCDYLFHRFASHSRPLWFTHENHHLPTDVSVYMPGLCARPFAVVAIFPTMLVSIFSLQLALGVSGLGDMDVMPFLYTAVLVQVGIGSMSHSAYLRRVWWIHRALKPLGLTTPQEHWLHHVAALDGNYGNFTTFWDRVFGTYLDPELIRSEEYRAGLDYDQDFLGTLTFGRLKLSGRVRRRFELQHFCYLEGAAAAASEPDSGTVTLTR